MQIKHHHHFVVNCQSLLHSPLLLCSIAFPYAKLTCTFDREYSFHAVDMPMIPSYYSSHCLTCAAHHLPLLLLSWGCDSNFFFNENWVFFFKLIFFSFSYCIILLYFRTKNTLKNNRYQLPNNLTFRSVWEDDIDYF
jgi:hypothetical protein